MELLLSAISTAGLAGAGNQYLCLIIISVGARVGWVHLISPLEFMQSWWFIAIVAVFWVLTVLPAYGSLLSPGVMNAVNTAVNFLSGFVVPASAALLALAAAGIIAEMDPELYNVLQTLQIFDPSGESIGRVGWLLAGGGALAASTVTGAKFLAKPAISTATGTAATVSAPTYATLENAASIVLMVLAYLLLQVDPWLLVGLLGLVVLIVLVVLGWSIYQLWRLGKGIGRLLRLTETHPKAGFSIAAEFLVWGAGWLVWNAWTRGFVRLVLWALWLVAVAVLIPAAGTAVSAALVGMPLLLVPASAVVVGIEMATVLLGLYVGARSAGALMDACVEGGEFALAPAPGLRPAAS